MKLEAKDGSSFEMILPPRTGEYNYLTISCSITNSEGTWTYIGYDFHIYEMKELADWFEGICRGERRTIFGWSDEKIIGFDFEEPWLLFQYTQDEDVRDVLRVIFDGDFIGATPPFNKEIWVDFPIEEVDLIRISEDLRQHLERYA